MSQNQTEATKRVCSFLCGARVWCDATVTAATAPLARLAATMILLAYRHGLRASEVCDLQWHQVELHAGRLHVRRTRNLHRIYPYLTPTRNAGNGTDPSKIRTKTANMTSSVKILGTGVHLSFVSQIVEA
jgi:type 1 fimbriae regulatory protein FimE